MTGPIRPERGFLLELIALLETIERLVAEGDDARFQSDDHYPLGHRAALDRSRQRGLRLRRAPGGAAVSPMASAGRVAE